MLIAMRKLFTTFSLMVVLYTVVSAQILDIQPIHQETSSWCWAASSQAILDYYGTSFSQCQIAEYARSATPQLPFFPNFGGTDCCVNPNSCSVGNSAYRSFADGGTIHDILATLGNIYSSYYSGSLTLSEIRNEISNGRPFIIYQNANFDGNQFQHFVVCRGIIGDQIFYMDPIIGGNGNQLTVLDYSNLVKGAHQFPNGVETIEWIGTLKMIASSNHNCNDPNEPNNLVSSATTVFQTPLTGSLGAVLTGNIGFSGDEDWYKIDLNTQGNLQIKLSHLPNDYEIYLYSDAGGSNLIDHSNHFLDPNGETVTFNNPLSSLVSVYAKVKATNNTDYWTQSCYNLDFDYTASSSCSLNGVTPFLSSPGTNSQPGSVITSTMPTLYWNPINSASAYSVSVTDINTSALVYTTCVTGTSCTIPTGLLNDGGNYKWSVTAKTGCSSSCVSNSSAYLYFTVQIPVACSLNGITPTLISPGTNALPWQTVTTTTPTLSWNAVPGAVNYGVYVRDLSSDILLVNNDCATSGTSFTIPSGLLTNGGQYRWNIIATDACGSSCTSFFSDRLYFQVQVSLGNYEYWFDNDYASKIIGTIASSQVQYTFNQLVPTTSLQTGLHAFHIRFSDNNGIWSSVNSQFFYKTPVTTDPNKLVTQYEYWFDDNYGNAVLQTVSPVTNHQLQANINSLPLTDGLHTFHFRHKDNTGTWSSVISQFFYKLGNNNQSVPNNITAYRYWYDMNSAGAVNVILPTPANPEYLNTIISAQSIPVGMHTVHFQFKDVAGYWSSVTNDTFLNQLGPHANFIANDTTLCYSGTVSFSNLSTNATSYQWTFGDGATSTAQNPTHTFSSSGLFTVRLIAIGSGNLHDTLTRTNYIRVTVPNVTVSSNTSICPGGSTTLTANGAGSYSWYPVTGLNIVTGASVSASPTTNTTYNVIGIDQYGCLDTAQVTVSVSNSVTVSINPSGAVLCSGNSVNLTASGATNYTWYPALNLNTTTGATVSASPSSTTVYYAIGTATCGTDTESITVTVNQTPVANAGTDISICIGQTANLSATGGISYLWSNGITTNSNSVHPTTNTTYTVTVSSNNCTASDDVSVIVNPVPVVTLHDTSICTGSTIVLDAQNAGSSYLWNDAATTQTHTVSSAGTYAVTVTNNFLCSASSSATITVSNNLNVQVNDTSICQGQTVVLNAGYAGSTYQWSNSNTSQTISVSGAGTYSVTVTHPSGCTGSDVAIITVNSNPTANAGGDVSICEGDQTVLTATGGNSYSWSNGTNTAINNVNPLTTSEYIVTVQNTFGCLSTDTVTVTVNQPPAVSLGNFNAICDNAAPLSLTSGSPVGGTYSGIGVVNGNFIPSIAGIGTHTITYTYTDGNGCTDSAHSQITITVCAGISEAIKGASVMLYPNPTTGIVTLFLKNATGICSVEIMNVVGQKIFTDQYDTTSDFATRFDLNLFADGTYYFKVGVGNSFFSTLKILKSANNK